jgi:hypothetical protein
LSRSTTRIPSSLKRRRINLINSNRMLPNTALNLTRGAGAPLAGELRVRTRMGR